MNVVMNIAIMIVASFLFGCQNIGFNENDDNTIYKVSRKFLFRVEFTASDNTVKRYDSLWLSVTDDFYPQAKQTAIIWKLKGLEGENTVEYKEKTGVVDSKEEFFIHPPRFGDFYVLSFAEFPSINTEVFNDTNNFYQSEGSVMMNKSFEGKTINRVVTIQKYLGKTKIDLPVKRNMPVHELHATAKSDLGTIAGNYFFSEKLGFVKLHYTLADSSEISITLLKTYF